MHNFLPFYFNLWESRLINKLLSLLLTSYFLYNNKWFKHLLGYTQEMWYIITNTAIFLIYYNII